MQVYIMGYLFTLWSLDTVCRISYIDNVMFTVSWSWLALITLCLQYIEAGWR